MSESDWGALRSRCYPLEERTSAHDDRGSRHDYGRYLWLRQKDPSIETHLLHVGSQDIDQLARAFAPFGIGFLVRIDDVMSDMILHNLGCQAVDCAPHRSDEH
jgi:hypothetical protein